MEKAFLTMPQNPKDYKGKDWEVCLHKNLKVLHRNKIKEVRRQYQNGNNVCNSTDKKNYLTCMICIIVKERPRNQ